jgi:hypothetical protein
VRSAGCLLDTCPFPWSVCPTPLLWIGRGVGSVFKGIELEQVEVVQIILHIRIFTTVPIFTITFFHLHRL